MPEPTRTRSKRAELALSRIVAFPFDLFGGGGAGAGATLLAEGLRELFADNRRETTPTRARAYAGKVHLRELSFPTLEDYQTWRRQGRRLARSALRAGEFLVWLAGNHLGALPVYDELAGEADTLVVQLDAHLDIQNFHDSSPDPSHANFLLHCKRPLPAVVNVGHRDLLLDPAHVAGTYRRTFPTAELAANPEGVFREIGKLTLKANRVFVDLDCDVFDPAFFPAVDRPVPFGLSPQQVLRVFEGIGPERLAGVLLSEFVPARDTNDQALATLLWLLEYLLLRRYE